MQALLEWAPGAPMGFRRPSRRQAVGGRAKSRSGRMLPSSSPKSSRRRARMPIRCTCMAWRARIGSRARMAVRMRWCSAWATSHLGVDEVVLHPAEHGAALAQVPQVRHAGGQGGVAAGGGDGAVKGAVVLAGHVGQRHALVRARMAASCAGVACCAASAAHSGSISMRASSRSKGPMSSAPAAARRRRRRAFAGGHEHARADAHFHVAFDFERDQRLADRARLTAVPPVRVPTAGDCRAEIARADPAGDLVGDHAVQAGDGNGLEGGHGGRRMPRILVKWSGQ